MKVYSSDHFAQYCKQRHDVDCNQKYGNNKPYSYHLNMVANTVTRFKDVLPDKDSYIVTYCGAWGHDLIEDARITYNDIKNMIGIKGDSGKYLGEDIAEVIYSCTEEKGKNRDERHSQKFFDELKENKLGVFVKLCDIISNVTESKNTGSGMFKKYQKEYPKLKSNLYLKEYDKLFVELETLLEIDN